MATYKIALKETRATGLASEQPPVKAAMPANQVSGTAAVRSETRDTSTNTEAMRAAQRLVVTEPQNGKAWADLGNLYAASGDSAQAIRAYAEAARLVPDDPGALEGLGAAYAKAGQTDKVREVWQKLGAIDKTRADKFFAAYILP